MKRILNMQARTITSLLEIETNSNDHATAFQNNNTAATQHDNNPLQNATNNTITNQPSDMLVVAHRLNCLHKYTSSPFSSNNKNAPYQHAITNNGIAPQSINNNTNNNETACQNNNSAAVQRNDNPS